MLFLIFMHPSMHALTLECNRSKPKYSITTWWNTHKTWPVLVPIRLFLSPNPFFFLSLSLTHTQSFTKSVKIRLCADQRNQTIGRRWKGWGGGGDLRINKSKRNDGSTYTYQVATCRSVWCNPFPKQYWQKWLFHILSPNTSSSIGFFLTYNLQGFGENIFDESIPTGAFFFPFFFFF